LISSIIFLAEDAVSAAGKQYLLKTYHILLLFNILHKRQELFIFIFKKYI